MNCLTRLFQFLCIVAGCCVLVLLLFGQLLPFHPVTSLLAFAPTPTVQVQGHSSYDVRHAPTISVQAINRILCQAQSPACGTGQGMYQQGVQYGIDPVYALAFFQHESTFGLRGIAQQTHGLGNIRCTPGWPSCVGSYRAYPSWERGYLDWYQLLSSIYIKQWHLYTVAAIVPVYAPARDGNNVHAYRVAVEQSVAAWREGRV